MSSSLLATYLIDQVVSIRYVDGDKAQIIVGQLVDQDGTFVRILSGEWESVHIPDPKSQVYTTQKNVFKLANTNSPSSYELINIQYIIGISILRNVDCFIPYGKEVVVCDDRGNCKVVYNNGPLAIVLERGGE